MNKNIFFVVSLFLIGIIGCTSSNSEKALLYNNQIVSIQDELTEDIDTFLQSINYPEANTAILYKSAQNTSLAVVDKLKLIKQFEGGTALFLETQNYISVCQTALQNEGSQIVHIKAKLSQEYQKEELAKLNQSSDSLYYKINLAAQKFDKVQKEFSLKYQFELEKEN